MYFPSTLLSPYLPIGAESLCISYISEDDPIFTHSFCPEFIIRSTNPESRLRGCFDLRSAWVKELQDAGLVKAVKVATDLNIADLLTKCHSTSTQTRLMGLVDLRVEELRNVHNKKKMGPV